MDLSKITVMLYKVGTKIRCGLDLFDTHVTTADKAKDLIRSDVWEDHPEKAKFVALPDGEKEQANKPEGLGFLTCIPGINHAAEVAEQEAEAEAAAKAAKAAKCAKGAKGGKDGDSNEG